MRLSARGFTLPWQLVELHEPGPVYLLVSAGNPAACVVRIEAKKIAPQKIMAHRSGQRFPSSQIFIRSLRWSVTSVARACPKSPRQNFLYCPGQMKSTNGHG